jgi:hypothetical protein
MTRLAERPSDQGRGKTPGLIQVIPLTLQVAAADQRRACNWQPAPAVSTASSSACR